MCQINLCLKYTILCSNDKHRMGNSYVTSVDTCDACGQFDVLVSFVVNDEAMDCCKACEKIFINEEDKNNNKNTLTL